MCCFRIKADSHGSEIEVIREKSIEKNNLT